VTYNPVINGLCPVQLFVINIKKAEGEIMDMRDKLLDYNSEFDNDDRFEACHQISMLVLRRDKMEALLEECKTILAENNWRGDLQDSISDIVGL